jgi:hypothetical protein
MCINNNVWGEADKGDSPPMKGEITWMDSAPFLDCLHDPLIEHFWPQAFWGH